MSLAKSHASRAQVPLRSIHGGIIRWRFGEKNAFNRGSKWKMSCQVQRVGPCRGSFSNSPRYGGREHDGKKKKREGKTFWLYSLCAKVVVRSMAPDIVKKCQLKIDDFTGRENKMLCFKQYHIQFIAKTLYANSSQRVALYFVLNNFIIDYCFRWSNKKIWRKRNVKCSSFSKLVV